MFEIQVEDARFWKGCVDAIVNLIEEGAFEVNQNGIYLKAMDPSQIAMVNFAIPKSAFASYKVDSAIRIGLNFGDLDKILARTRGKERLTMGMEENRLTLEFKEQSKRSFKVPLVEVTTTVQKEPKIDYDAVIKINGGQFKEILRDAALLSSHIVLEANDKGFFVEVHGDSGDLKVESEKTNEATLDMNLKKQARATFPLQFLDDIVKACPDNGIVTLNLKTNAPIKVEYPIGDAYLIYYLAPRIETM
jgi:proliferating cell nuclear antigen